MALTPPPIPQRMGVDFPRFLRSSLCRVVTWLVIVALLLTDLPLPLAPSESWATVVAFGPEDFVRSTGKPQEVVRTFAVANPTGTWTLCIANGGQNDQYARVSSAVVTLNKITVVGPSAFNQNVRQITRAVTLKATNELRVEVRSQPGSGITLSIVQGTHCQNTSPVANAGPDQTVFVTQSVQLDGSGSSDGDGDLLQFHWSMVSKPLNSTAALSNPTAVKPTFVADRPGQYVLQLIVNDGQVDSTPDQVIISTQNSKPVANAGLDQTMPLGLRVFLDGSKSSDVDGDLLSYHWTLISQPAGSTATLDNATTASPSFIPDKAGSYTAQLIVNDGKVNSDPDTVVISTQNSKPVANAGSDQTVQVGDTVQLDGSGSADADGDPLIYQWSFTSKPDMSSAAFPDPAAPQPTFVADKVGLYVVQLIVNDGKENSDPDTASITVKVVPPVNHPPVADAGTDQTVSVGATVMLDGSGSSDPDGDTLTYHWEFSLKPANSQAVVQNADTATPSFVADVAGPYSVQLTVNDGRGGSASDIVDIIVTTTSNQPPVITSTAVTTASVGQPYTYDVEATDPDGDVLTFSLPTAPAGMTIDSVTGLIQWTPTAAQAGDNTVTVHVQDAGGLFATQSFLITVTPAGANHPPEITSTPTVSYWTQLTPTGTPPTPRGNAGVSAYDEVNDRLILFSGEDGTSNHPQDVWVLVNATGAQGTPQWVQLQPSNAGPTGRANHTAVYDFTANRLIIFGGCVDHCTPLGDTWVLTNANGLGGTPEWIRLPDTSPRALHAAVYSPLSNRMIVFGGLTGGKGSDLSTVTVLIDANGIGNPQWIDLTVTGTPPPARGHESIATYDELNDRLIIFGGNTSTQKYFNDTWVLTNASGEASPSQWTQLQPLGPPPTPRGFHRTVYDANSNRLILFGGADSSGSSTLNDSWVLTNANGLGGTPQWLQTVQQVSPPPGRSSHSVAYARASNTLFMGFGNIDTAYLNDAWVLSNTSGQCTANQPCNYDVDATDPDIGDVLTFSLDTAPAGMTIDPATGLIEWTPTPAQIGDHNVTVRVHDTGGLSATQAFSLTVAQVAVPNVVGLDPAAAEALLSVADLDVGTLTNVGGGITLNFDSLPSAQGWTFYTVGASAPENSIFSINAGVLTQNTLGLGGIQAMYALPAVDRRLPFTLSTRARVLQDESHPTHPGISFFVDTAHDAFAFGLKPNRAVAGSEGAFIRVVDQDSTIFHDYVLAGRPGGEFRLSIDGTVFLDHALPYIQSDVAGPPRVLQIQIGDPAPTGDNAHGEVTAYAFAQPRVISQNPPAGTLVPNQSAVDLTVQDGPTPTTVPNVVGMTQANAEAAIVAANLTVGTVTTANSDTVPAGQVINQAPVAGTSVPPNTAVNFVVSIGSALTVPDVVGLTQAAAEAAITAANLTVGSISTAPSPTVPAGNVISQNPVAGTVVSPGSAVSFVVSSGPPQPPCALSSILVQPVDPLILVGQTQPFTALGICNDGTSQNLAGQVAWASSNATAAAIDGNGITTGHADGTTTISASLGGETGSTTLIVHATTSGDTTFPTAEITTPADDSTITSPTDVIGTATDANFFKYVSDYAPVGQTTFTTLTTGTAPVTNGVLGTFDPTLLINDLYTLRLTVFDTANNATETSVRVQVSREQKVGNFTLAFQDLSIPVSCLPITVTRTYDSRDKGQGDFGIGWRLDVKTIRLRESSQDEDGAAWHVDLIDKPGPFGVPIPTFVLVEDDLHKVSITLPDGKVEEFDLTPQPSESQVQKLVNTTAVYTPRPGTVGSLAVPANQQNLVVEGGQLFYDDLSGVFDPQTFIYTAPDGTAFTIHRFNGVQQVQCTNGPTLTFGPNGITHSLGKGVAFTRDAQGRITTITDPKGNQHLYAYNANGDLGSVVDPEQNTTKFTYNYRHGLLDIIDPRGVRAIRNEYDDAGRLISNTDAGGHTIQYTHNLVARTETVKDRLGHVTTYAYDDKGNVLEQIDALGHSTKFTYDAFGNEETRTDPLNRTITRTYDLKRNVLSEKDPLNHTTTYIYTALNAVKMISDPLGHMTTNNYDAKGNLLSTTDPSGKTTSYTYDTGGVITQGTGNLLSTTDALNHTTSYDYDSTGNLIKETDPTTHVSTYEYDNNGNRTKQTTTRQTATGTETLITTYTYDNLNRLTQTTYPDGSTTQTIYNSIGKQSATIDQLSRQTTYAYDDLGRLVNTTYPDSTSESSTYDAEGRRLSSKDRAGRTTSYTYDVLGRLTKTTHPGSATETTTYDIAGQVIETTDARGNVTKYAYDDAGRRTTVIDALTHEMSFTYDEVGNQKTITDANTHTTTYIYDNNNRRTQVSYPDGTTEKTDYDALGRTIKKTDQAGKITQFTYDALGRLTMVTDALGQDTTYTYDEQGNQLTQTDANNHTTSFAYDRLGRRVKRTLPLGQFETYEYDEVGNQTKKTDFNGKTTTYAYDAVNRLTSKTPDPSLNEPTVSFTYTPTGQRASMNDASGTTTYTYDNRDRLTEKATPQGTLTYTYDQAGNLLSIDSSHANGVSVDYAYDALNRLSKVTDNRLASGVTTYSYDDVGNLESYLYPNGIAHQYTYNSLNRLTDLTISKVTTLASYVYDLGPAGNRTVVTEQSGRKVSYTYDGLYRLTQEQIDNDPASLDGTISYDYDPVGNRKTRTSTVAGIPNQTFTYDPNDRLNTDTYDDNGNTTGSGGNTYDYDYENHLTEQNGGGVIIIYDGDGNRVSKTIGGVTTQYLVDDRNHTGYAQVLEEIVNGAAQRQYTYGLDLISQNQSSGVSFYGYDGQGSVRLLADSNGAVTDTYEYEAFGNMTGSTGGTPNNYLYAGEQSDPNVGFYYLRARYLNANKGRFITSDKFEGITFDPRTLHKYVYVSNNPINLDDPSGMLSMGTLTGIVATTIILTVLVQAYVTNLLASRLSSQISNNGLLGAFDGLYLTLRGTHAFRIGAYIAGGVDVVYDPVSGSLEAAPVFEGGINPLAAFGARTSPFTAAVGLYGGATNGPKDLEKLGLSAQYPIAAVPYFRGSITRWKFWGVTTQVAMRIHSMKPNSWVDLSISNPWALTGAYVVAFGGFESQFASSLSWTFGYEKVANLPPLPPEVMSWIDKLRSLGSIGTRYEDLVSKADLLANVLP